MALKQIILGDKLRKAQERMAQAQQKAEEARSQRTELEKREQELIQAREEVTEETTPEEQTLLEEQITAWEEQEASLQETEQKISEEIEAVQQEIADLQQQLDEVNARAAAKPKAPEAKPEERKERTTMSKHSTRHLWFGMDHQERDAFIAREDVKAFAQRVRQMIAEKRAMSGAELTIPTVVLPLIRQVASEASKLLKHINVQRVSGEGRQNIMGLIPEAIWTEACGKINEIDLTIGVVELDGYKVGAFVPLCNALKEDSDLDLITEVSEAIGKAIGIAVDKAILYGTGTKMPKGIVTTLTGDSELADTHVVAITGKTDAALFKALIEAVGVAESEYTSGEMFWAMNNKTRTKLVSNAVSINAAGAIVSGVENTMPVIGGAIETLAFIPDDVVIGGYGDMYVMVERAGTTIAVSEHYRFVEDQTVVKGTARYDGLPVIASAFVAIGIGGTKPTAGAVTFAADTANAA